MQVTIFCTALLCMTPADAYFVRFTANLGVFSPGVPVVQNKFIDTGEVPALSVTQPLVTNSDAGDNGSATASVQGEVSPGHITLMAHGTAFQGDASTSNYSIQPYLGRPSWGDEMTVTTSGTFKFTLTMESTVSGGPSKGEGMATTPGAQCSSNMASAFLLIDGSVNVINVIDELCDGNQTKQAFTKSVEISYDAGRTLTLSGNLEYVLIGNSNSGVTVTTQINALNSVRYYIDPVTPGASYTMASGVDYRTPVSGMSGSGQLPIGILPLLLEE